MLEALSCLCLRTSEVLVIQTHLCLSAKPKRPYRVLNYTLHIEVSCGPSGRRLSIADVPYFESGVVLHDGNNKAVRRVQLQLFSHGSSSSSPAVLRSSGRHCSILRMNNRNSSLSVPSSRNSACSKVRQGIDTSATKFPICGCQHVQ